MHVLSHYFLLKRCQQIFGCIQNFNWPKWSLPAVCFFLPAEVEPIWPTFFGSFSLTKLNWILLTILLFAIEAVFVKRVSVLSFWVSITIFSSQQILLVDTTSENDEKFIKMLKHLLMEKLGLLRKLTLQMLMKV